jgi:predicted phosphodiesterase
LLETSNRIALIADAHGHVDILTRALDACRAERVDALVFLGDLIDRRDQADACADALEGWHAFGVYGNHEEELIATLANGGGAGLNRATVEFFQSLEPRIVLGDACFVHDELEEPRVDPLQKFFNRTVQPENSYRVLFVGHTHHRAAMSDHGPLDTAHAISLDAARRYVINPGALVGGKFAIWERTERVVRFMQVR